MIWRASVGTLKWGIPFLNHDKWLLSTAKVLLPKGNKKVTKENKLIVGRLVLAALESESVCENSVWRGSKMKKTKKKSWLLTLC